MLFQFHRGRSVQREDGTWHHDPYDRPRIPHHIHIETGCAGQSDICLDEHWLGGKPERSWPHHVEIDCSSGCVGYTRLTEEEINDLKTFQDFMDEDQAARAAEQQAELELIKSLAKSNPAMAALLRRMGVDTN